jgi:hypothetical protein
MEALKTEAGLQVIDQVVGKLNKPKKIGANWSQTTRFAGLKSQLDETCKGSGVISNIINLPIESELDTQREYGMWCESMVAQRLGEDPRLDLKSEPVLEKPDDIPVNIVQFPLEEAKRPWFRRRIAARVRAGDAILLSVAVLGAIGAIGLVQKIGCDVMSHVRPGYVCQPILWLDTLQNSTSGEIQVTATPLIPTPGTVTQRIPTPEVAQPIPTSAIIREDTTNIQGIATGEMNQRVSSVTEDSHIEISFEHADPDYEEKLAKLGMLTNEGFVISARGQVAAGLLDHARGELKTLGLGLPDNDQVALDELDRILGLGYWESEVGNGMWIFLEDQVDQIEEILHPNNPELFLTRNKNGELIKFRWARDLGRYFKIFSPKPFVKSLIGKIGFGKIGSTRLLAI